MKLLINAAKLMRAVHSTHVFAIWSRAASWSRGGGAMFRIAKTLGTKEMSEAEAVRLGDGPEKGRPVCVCRSSLWALIFSLFTGFSGMSASAQEVSAPPYYIGRGEYVILKIAYDESRIKRVAPSDLQIASGTTGRIVMYTAGDNAGLPPYSSSWIGLEVDGFDTPDGSKARWMLSGLYSPASVAAALAKHFNYPTREGTTWLGRDGRRVVAVGTMGGHEIIRAELILKDEPCQRVSGLVHEVTRNPTANNIQLIKIPTLGDWCAAESATVKITAPTGDPFNDVGPVKVLWGGYFYGGFGWPPAAVTGPQN